MRWWRVNCLVCGAEVGDAVLSKHSSALTVALLLPLHSLPLLSVCPFDRRLASTSLSQRTSRLDMLARTAARRFSTAAAATGAASSPASASASASASAAAAAGGVTSTIRVTAAALAAATPVVNAVAAAAAAASARRSFYNSPKPTTFVRGAASLPLRLQRLVRDIPANSQPKQNPRTKFWNAPKVKASRGCTLPLTVHGRSAPR